jgi:glycosyltransferase involved in cell wall biosynthesis
MKIIYHHRTQAEKAEGVHIREVIKALRNEGHEVFVISPAGIDSFCNEYSNKNPSGDKRSLWNFISAHTPQLLFEVIEILYNFFAFLKFYKLLNKERIDLIYERYAFFCWVGCFIAKKLRIPIIIEVNEISGIKRTRGQVLISLSRKIEKFVFERASAICVVSEFLKENIEKSGIEPGKIFVIPNGVDAQVFDPNRIDASDLITRFGLNGKIVLGFVGNFVQWHNFDFLLNAFKDITQEQSNALLLLVGDGPARHEIETYAKDYFLNGKVVITGSVPHHLIARYIKLMDICIIPHSNEYRSPIKMFEYMAMAKPVVAPKIGPIARIIQDNINGKLFLLNNEESFKASLLDLIKDHKARENLGNKARDTILSKYLWKNNAEKILEIYNNLGIKSSKSS